MTDATATVPSITGNNGLDSLIRSGLIGASGAITGVILTWLNAHGFNDPNLNLMVSAAIFALLVAGATALWGYLKGTSIGRTIASIETTAVQAGILAGNAGVTAPVVATHDNAKTIVKLYAPEKP